MTTAPPYDPNKARLRAISRGVGSKLFNQKVVERYGDNQDLLDTCLIQSFDTIPEIIDKKLTFFFVLENYTPVVEERVHIRGKKTKSSASDNIPWMILHFKFKEKYIEDRDTGELKRLGQRQLKCCNVNLDLVDTESIKKTFDGLSIFYGDRWIGYNFTNGKEIRLKYIERDKAIILIDKLNEFTLKEYQQDGKAEENIYDLGVPKKVRKPDNYGLTGHLFKITFHAREGNKTKRLRSVMIQNKISNKKVV